MPYGLVTVFGGTGFLGRCIVEHLHTAGARVRVAVRHTTEGIPPQGGDIEVVYADIRDGATVAQAVRDSDAVVKRYCQELWIGEAWSGGFLPIFFVFTAFDLNTINERNTSTHQG
jgi:NAD(P)-dependent dehydrogenase (short-subunit alcohol dehydrogenase family)